jgi:arabinofuranan 3-O-arabinosyltransferase
MIRSDPATMQLTVGQRSQESVLTVAQNFNEGWAARDAAGRRLVAIRLDGWKQGWVLPPGAATVVTARFTPDGWYRGGLLVGLLTLVCAAALVPLSRRRRWGLARREVPGESSVPAGVVIGCGGVLLVFMSGWTGVMAGVVAGLLVLLESGVLPGVRRSRGSYLPGLIMALGLVAGVLAATQPWLAGSAGLQSGTVQGLTLLAFTLACAAALRGGSSTGTSAVAGEVSTSFGGGDASTPSAGGKVSGSPGGGETSKPRSLRPRRMMGRSTSR